MTVQTQVDRSVANVSHISNVNKLAKRDEVAKEVLYTSV